MAFSAFREDNSNEAPLTLSLSALFYNEEASVEAVIREAQTVLRRTGETFEIVAIQNGSLDSTPQILRRLSEEIPELRTLIIPVNQGAGYGARKGLYACNGRYVIGVSGDGQVDLQVIPAMFRTLRDTGSELAYGKRRTRPDGAHRAVISAIYRTIMRIAFGLASQDMNGLPKIVERKALHEMQIVSDDHFLECEMMLKAARMGLRVCALDVDFFSRGGGKSSIGFSDVWAYVDHLVRVGTGVGDLWKVKRVPRRRPRAEWLYFPNGTVAGTSDPGDGTSLQRLLVAVEDDRAEGSGAAGSANSVSSSIVASREAR
jgi:glycosyltransferase involved in cell wall biosynthesis